MSADTFAFGGETLVLPSENIFQFDDVTVSLIGPGAKAVLGYTDGRYVNRSLMLATFPKALHTFLTVTGLDFTADGVDSEAGDAPISQVVAFMLEKRKQGKRGVAYTFLAQFEEMYQAILAAGIPRDEMILLCAHVTGVPHICGPECGYGLSTRVDATQYTFTAEGRSLDESLCTPAYFKRDLVPPKPKDPHHYHWFGEYRSDVEEYDAFRPHPIKNRKVLKLKRAQLLRGAKRIAANVIHEAPKAGTPARKAAWSKDRRGWRYAQLIHRANGKRVVK